MDVMTAYTQSLSDADLLALSERNLVTSQMRVVLAELERRGLEAVTNA